MQLPIAPDMEYRAFVSMLGIALLNEIVRRDEIVQANQILEELRKEVKNSLRQKGERGENKDGMDIALCIINTKTNMLQYAGAYNPLFIYRNNNIITFKANTQPIAIYIKERPFTNHEFQLKKDDIIYAFSDGYIDQFGGEYGKKFLKAKFKNLILGMPNKTMQEQKQVFESVFNKWIGTKHKQIDDILVMGIKI